MCHGSFRSVEIQKLILAIEAVCFCDENEGFGGWRKKYSTADLINYNPIYFPQVTSPPFQCRRTFIPWSRLNGGTYIVSKAAAFKQFLCFRKLSLFITTRNYGALRAPSLLAPATRGHYRYYV